MNTVNIAIKAFKTFMTYEDKFPRLFWIVVLSNVAIIIFLAFANVIAGLKGNINRSAFKITSDEYWFANSFLGRLFHEINVVTQLLLLPVISIAVLSVGRVVLKKPELFGDRFYIEVIVITIAGALLRGLLIKLRDIYADHFNSEAIGNLETRVANVIVLSIIYAFISFVAIFINLETLLPGIGGKLLGISYGAWGYAIYVAVFAFIIVRSVGHILSLLSMLFTIRGK